MAKLICKITAEQRFSNWNKCFPPSSLSFSFGEPSPEQLDYVGKLITRHPRWSEDTSSYFLSMQLKDETYLMENQSDRKQLRGISICHIEGLSLQR